MTDPPDGPHGATARSSLLPDAHGLSHDTTGPENGTAASSTQDIEVLFDRYQRLMASNMPFVVLPTGTTAITLIESKSFLIHAIAVVATFHDTTKQQSMAKDLMRDLCERQLVTGQKTLDLLQGLLVFSNWYNPHLYSPQNSTNLLHLAMALTTDLNIDREPGNCEKAQMEAATKAYGVAQPPKILSNDERRAVLGTFYLASVIFTSFRKVDAMHWTPWLTTCADVLGEAQEYESDGCLVQLVKMQGIMQEAMTVEYSDAPIQFFANSFIADLKRLGSLPKFGTIATVSRLQDACTRIAIWQRAFVGLTSETVDSSTLRQRLDGMWRCMEAVKAYLDIYLAIPVEDYPLVPFWVFAQFAYTFVVIVRALAFELDGWNATALRGLIDFSSIMEEAARRYEAVSQVLVDSVTLKNEAFSKWAAKLRWAKAFHDAKLMSTTLEHDRVNTDQANHDARPPVSTQHLPTPPGVAMEASLNSLMNLEDFWSGFSEPSQFLADFNPTFGDI